MHAFRWFRFLSLSRRGRPSTPRRSSWIRRHFYRPTGYRTSAGLSSSSASPASESRPTLIHIDCVPLEARRRRHAVASTTTTSAYRRRSNTEEEDRRFIEEFHSQYGNPETLLSPTARNTTASAMARMSSMFKPARRSTIMERASILNLFNQLQFELPPVDPDPGQADFYSYSYSDDFGENGGAGLTSPAKSSKNNTHEDKKRKKENTGAFTEDGDDASELARNKELSLFRQYLYRVASTKSTIMAARDESATLRPVLGTQHDSYLEAGSTRSSAPRSTTTGSRWEEDEELLEPIQFLFFGGSAEENLHKLREVDAEPRRYRARFLAQQPTPSCTASIHIKPSLVCNLPSVFEPTFAYTSVYM